MEINGARTGRPWERLAVPQRYDLFPDLAGTPAHSVTHSYARVVAALTGGPTGYSTPTFADALTLHHILEGVRASAEAGTRVTGPWQS